jgi:predicted nuclease with TOPRIM domain
MKKAILVVIAIGAWLAPARAQSTRTDDVLPALLQEVRGLRAAIEQMATSNAHAQLLVGRLQLQESRMNGMTRRLDTVRDEHAKAQAGYDQLKSSLQFLESHALNELPQGAENEIPGTKHALESAKAAADRWAAEEAQLTVDLTAEQARWMDINQRLDELERSLARR